MALNQEKFNYIYLSDRPVLGVKRLIESAVLPDYANPGDSGMDIYPLTGFTIEPGQRKLIQTGIALSIPQGYEIQVRSRSGLALKKGVIVLNSPGTVDQAYVGEIGVILQNTSDKQFISTGIDAIAQLVLCEVSYARLEEVDELPVSSRGTNGYGSTDTEKS